MKVIWNTFLEVAKREKRSFNSEKREVGVECERKGKNAKMKRKSGRDIVRERKTQRDRERSREWEKIGRVSQLN